MTVFTAFYMIVIYKGTVGISLCTTRVHGPCRRVVDTVVNTGIVRTMHLCQRAVLANVKSDENVRLCMDTFNCDDVDTMLMKRMQKLFDGYEHLDILLCQITMSYNCN